MTGMLKSVAATVAIGSLALAQPAMAANASHRTASPTHATEGVAGSTGFLIPAIALAAVVLLLVATVGHHDGDNNPDTPASP